MKTAALAAFLYTALLAVTETNFALILTATPLIMTSLAGLVVSLRNSFKADKIAASVDGNMSRMQEDLAIANSRIEKLLHFYPQSETRIPASLSPSPTSEPPTKVEVVNAPSDPVPTTPVKKQP